MKMRNLLVIGTAAVVLASLLNLSMVQSQAFATQDYVAGYTHTTTITKGSNTGISFRTDYSGTTTTTPRSGSLISVVSAATYATSGATTPTGWTHQQAVVLDSGSNIVGGGWEVYNGITCVHSHQSSSCAPGNTVLNLGTYGTGTGNVDYVYMLMSMTSTQIRHYYESVSNGGSIIAMPTSDYNKSSDSDPSNYFATGKGTVTVDGTTRTYKLLQFGVESSSEVTQTWKVTQYDLTAVNQLMQNIPFRTVEYTISPPTYDSCVTRYIRTDGLPGCVKIGAGDYSVAHVDGNFNDPTIPKGKIIWSKGTMTTGGTHIWD